MNITIIGSGIVGQATGIGLSYNGNKVLFHDINLNKVLALKNKGYEATDNIEKAVANSDVIFVCVPTPTINEKIDLKHIESSAISVGKALRKTRKYPVIAFRSTIPPQTTRTRLIPCLEKYSLLNAGTDFGVCMNPEFLREKSPLQDFLNPSRIVIGRLDEKSGEKLKKVYSKFNCPLILTDLETAEMIKYTSNIFLAAKISFFNEIFMICNELGLDSKVISEAVALDPRIGTYGVFGGKPFGGMCLPKDLYAFIEFASSKGLSPRLLYAIAEVNKEINTYNLIKQELPVWRD